MLACMQNCTLLECTFTRRRVRWQEYPQRVAFSLIAKAVDEFKAKFPVTAWTASPKYGHPYQQGLNLVDCRSPRQLSGRRFMLTCMQADSCAPPSRSCLLACIVTLRTTCRPSCPSTRTPVKRMACFVSNRSWTRPKLFWYVALDSPLVLDRVHEPALPYNT